jgi:hypothetical protein
MLATVGTTKTGYTTGPIGLSKHALRGVSSRASAGEKGESMPTLDRRSALLVSLGMLLGSVESAQAATSDAYYESLKANTKGLESIDLLSRYSSLKDDGGKKGGSRKASSKNLPKNVAKNAEALGLKGSKMSSAKASNLAPRTSKAASPAVRKATTTSAASSASFNPVEVGLGLLALAGVGAIGARGSSKASSLSPRKAAPVKKASTPPPAPKKNSRSPPPAPKKNSRSPPPAPKKKAGPVGTQKLRSGTRPVQAAKTKRIGTLAKSAVPTEKKGGSGAVGAVMGVVALVGAAVVLSGGSLKDGKQVAAPKAPNAVEIKAKGVNATAAPAVAPAVKVDNVEKTQALIVKVEEKKPEPAASATTPKSKLPPTTGNSPAVLIGGSLMALVAAAAVGGPAEGDDSTPSASVTPAASSGTDDPSARAREARQWIDAWKARQKYRG